MYRRLILLTCSQKLNGYCVSGIDHDSGEWIRPVSKDEENDGAVPESDLRLDGGGKAGVFDVVELELTEKAATEVQSENWRYSPKTPWKKIGYLPPDYVRAIIKQDEQEYLFGDTERSITREQLTGESLYLAEIRNIHIWSERGIGRKKCYADFEYKGREYRKISVGDIELKSSCGKNGIHIEGSRYAVFSLTNKFRFNGKYYKMLAQLF